VAVDDQDAFIQSLIAHRSCSPQKIVALLNNTPPEVLACLPQQENDALDHLLLPHSDPIPFFHILSSRLQTCFNKIDIQRTLSQAHRFCASLNPKQLHLISPTNAELCLFASLLVEWSSQAGQLQSSIEPLWQLIQSYAPLNILTPLHHELLKISLKTRSIDRALELTNIDIDIDQQNYPIRYQDHLIYHYLAGIVQALAKNYQRAIHLLTMAVSAPGSAISQIQVDAYKKLILVSLLANSSPAVLPPYTNPQFKAAFKNAPNTKAYLDFMNSYERAETSNEAYVQLVTLAERNISTFRKDNNSGLIKLCIEILPQKAIKKLIPIYTSIPIAKIDRLLGKLTDGNASGLVHSMIQLGELKAQIDPNTNVVMFEDEEETLEDPEKTHMALKQIIERVQVTEQKIVAKSAEIEQDKELLKRLIQDLRSSSAEKQQLPSSNDCFQAGPGVATDRLSSGIIEEELVDVGMSWDD